jgi:tRNA A-37 threonylcarbamoyl transferase component Bud32
MLKDDRKTKAARVQLCGRTYFLKKYPCDAWHSPLKNALRLSRAMHTWLVIEKWRAKGLPVPKPLVCLEERHFRLLRRSYVLSEFIDDGRPLTIVWPKLDPGDKSKLIVQLAAAIGRIHAAGGLHGDLKWPNILVRKNEDEYSIVFCDTDASHLLKHVRKRKARKELNRFLRDLNGHESGVSYQNSFLRHWEKRLMA